MLKYDKRKRGGERKMTMIKRYEVTDEEWGKIGGMFPAKQTGKKGRPSKKVLSQVWGKAKKH